MSNVLQASVAVTFAKLVNSTKTDSLSATLVSTMLTPALVRGDVTVLSAATETNYLPTGISTVNFLMVTATGNPVLLRTVAAGTQYKIPAGGCFLAQMANTGLSGILLTGGGTGDAQVTFIVGQ